jgi:hypothetical protein
MPGWELQVNGLIGNSMGVKRHWKIQKLAQLPLSEETRAQLIQDIMRRKQPHVPVYAWDVSNGIAQKVFVTKNEAIKDWYVNKRIWEQEAPTCGVLLHSWKVKVDELLQNSKNTKLRNMALPEDAIMDVTVIPSSLQEDIRRTLKI